VTLAQHAEKETGFKGENGSIFPGCTAYNAKVIRKFSAPNSNMLSSYKSTIRI